MLFRSAAALGVRFLDEDEQEIRHNASGLARLHAIDRSGLDPRLKDCHITIACDVDNILCGPHGASYVFGPQKGATADMLPILDQNLYHYSELINSLVGFNTRELPGTGAAGGLAVSLIAFADCEIRPGISIVLDMVDFDSLISDADLIITGEGQIDGQSLRGKVPIGIAKRAQSSGVPVLAIVGAIGDNLSPVYEQGIAAIFTTCQRPATFDEIKETCQEIGRAHV